MKNLAKDVNEEVAQTAQQVIGERQGNYTCEAIRKNYQIPPEVLKKLAQTNSRCITYIAKHPNTPEELLLEFSQSTDKRLRQEVAKNINLPINILEILANDEDFWVRGEISRNPLTPISLLFKQLAREIVAGKYIAYQISSKVYNCPEVENILDILAEESTSSLETILQRLIRDGGDTAHYFLARRFDLPADLLAQIAQSDEFKIREAVAQNPNASSTTLEQLAQAPELKLRITVAQNPNTPIYILDKLAKDENSLVRMQIASRTSLSLETLIELASDEKSEVRKKAFQNPNLPKEVVERILCSEDAFDFLKLNPDYLSHHPQIKALLINSDRYFDSKCVWVKYITLIQPEANQELLQEKSNSISWIERLAVAQNPQITQDIREKLAHDSNQLVRAAAISWGLQTPS
ncbi:MAG: hypothetical protein MJK14_09540 [Rivularia sp. ALOHA_DT_140]|nr:hypothetical protein [Rivularia sp. ALOHA_DT_140]